MKYILLFFLMITSYRSHAQQAGYRKVILTDSSRHYQPGAHPGDPLCFRPVEMDCWYPATATAASPILYGEFLRLFEERANRFQHDTIYSGLARNMAEYLCGGFGIKDSSTLTSFRTQSFRDASPIPGRYPLIVYMCSYNGMCFENIRLFEMLAQSGYIVVSVTSVGRYPGNMTTDPADLLEQVADGAFAINQLRKSETFDTTHIGLIGYSWGGPAAFLLAENFSIRAILSLDGSELHYYGQSGGEDSNFNRIRPNLLRTAKLPIAYAYLESGGKQADEPADSVFNLHEAFQGRKKYVRFPAATHEDFSCLSYLAAYIQGKDFASLPDYPGFAINWFDNILKNGTNQLPPDSPYPVVWNRSDKTKMITAKVLDAEDKSPLAFVNVGIPDKNVGTVTREDGSFTLAINPQLATDSFAISMAGYEKQTIPINRIPGVVLLARKSGGLTEVVVTSALHRTRKLGNSTTSKLVSIGFPMRFLGAEIGLRMTLGKHPRYLEKFYCHVSGTRIDSAIFRLNIYKMVNDKPVNLLQRNIILSIGKEPGDYPVDLSAFHLSASGDILVSLELLRSYSSSTDPGAVYFSAAFFNSGTWRRQTSQAEWRKAHGIGVGFTLEVQ